MMAKLSDRSLWAQEGFKESTKSSSANTLDDYDNINDQRTPSWATRSRKRSYADTGFGEEWGVVESGHEKHGVNRRGSEEDEEDSHSSKKSRHNKWPLANPANDKSPSKAKRFSAPNSKSQDQSTSQTSDGARSSKFVEGSMNDRVSKVPPKNFMEDGSREDGHTVFMDKPQGLEREGRQDGDEDPKRSSGIFKFGKSVVAAFSNAFNYTTEMTQKLKPEREAHERRKREIREQKERYFAAYTAKKKQGGFDPIRVGTHQKHDSRVHMGNAVSFDIGRENVDSAVGQASGPLNSQDDSDVRGLALETPSIRRPRLLTKRASQANLRKAKSDVQMSSTHNHLGASEGSSTVLNLIALQVPKTLRKQTSKKDVQKQQKLSKKVSDLEVKLELARRQFHESLGEDIPPVPPLPRNPSAFKRPFVPGLLATLPSERFLNGNVNHEGMEHSSDEEEVELVPVNRDSSPEKVYSTNAPTARKVTDMPEISEEADLGGLQSQSLEEALATANRTTAKKAVTEKRKGSEDTDAYRPTYESESESGSGSASEGIETSAPPYKKRITTHRKQTKTTPKSKLQAARSIYMSKLPRPRSTSPPPSLSYSKPTTSTITRSSSIDSSATALHPLQQIFTATPHQDEAVPPLPKLSKKMERILGIAANGGESPRPRSLVGAGAGVGIGPGTRTPATARKEADMEEQTEDDDDEHQKGKQLRNPDGTPVLGPSDPIKKLARPSPGRRDVVNVSKAEEFEWDADIF